MITVSRLNGELVHINPDLLRWVESKPDTTLCFSDGLYLVVKETPAEVCRRIVEFRKQLASSTDLLSPSYNDHKEV